MFHISFKCFLQLSCIVIIKKINCSLIILPFLFSKLILLWKYISKEVSLYISERSYNTDCLTPYSGGGLFACFICLFLIPYVYHELQPIDNFGQLLGTTMSLIHRPYWGSILFLGHFTFCLIKTPELSSYHSFSIQPLKTETLVCRCPV